VDDPAHANDLDQEDPAAAFVRASRALVGIAIRSVDSAPVEVTVPQHRVLVLLATHGDLTIGEVAAELGVNPSNATRHCDRLQRLGLLRRRRSEWDGRVVLVAATPAGLDVVTAVDAARREEVQRVLADMADADVAAALRGLSAFADAAHEAARIKRDAQDGPAYRD
jgi:DNA-binding MarR family transcriptional regulator